MAIHVYECARVPFLHNIEMDEPASHEMTKLRCAKCGAKLVLSAAVSTAAPILKAGSGGFYNPTKTERSSEE